MSIKRISRHAVQFRTAFYFTIITATTLTGCPGPDNDRAAISRTATVTPDSTAAAAGGMENAVLQMWTSMNSSKSVVRAREQDAIARDKEWSATVTAAMDAIEWRSVFTGPDGLTPAMTHLQTAMDEVPSHGLKPESCGVPQLQSALEQFSHAAQRQASVLAKLADLKGWLELEPLLKGNEKPSAEALAQLPEGVRKLKKKELALLLDGVAELVALRKADAATMADLEIAAVTAYLKYVMNMRYRLVAAPFLAQKNPATAHDEFKDKLVESFTAFVSAPEETLSSLPPSHPYYRMVMDGLAAYRKMALAGEFPQVNITRKISPGAKGQVIEDIKNRLAREGYFTGTIDQKFDADLKSAVEKYQKTHGFNVTGILEPQHGKSMNVSIERRIAQIELSLQRWRESPVRDDGELYVRVNIPEFHMEVWHNGVRQFKNRVVVGNNNFDRDPGAKVEGRLNRTKLFSAMIQDIVLNPRWNVPARIRQVELEMDLLSQPDYLLKHGYVVEMMADGREIVYQKSGDGNALGRIKFNFPNEYGIFMHDTNLKSFFGREIRAFSHGCVRLDDPVPVAKYFLKLGSDIDEATVDIELAKDEPAPKSVKLSKPIPIHIEYNSVGVEDDGTMMFFSDVYGYDRDFFDGKIPYSSEELELLHRKVTQPD